MKFSDVERFEVKAEAFRLMTGHMAPGKDASPHSYPAPLQERAAAWDSWEATHAPVLRAMMMAVERVIDGDRHL